jgi:DNA-binding LacI/PurR family transcriptional regulator
MLAISVMAGLRRAGLSIPGDVSVTGFDGISIGRHVHPTLATIEQPTREMGRRALSLLLDIRAGVAPPALSRLAHRFRPGGSLAAAPGGMAGALRAAPADTLSKPLENEP